MKRTALPLLVLLPLLSTMAIAEHGVSLNAETVFSIHDGDTITAMDGGKRVRVRLACIDAPELGQRPWGSESKQYLQRLLPKGSTISLRKVATDRYGRSVAEVFQGSTNVNLAMVLSGQALVYRQYLRNCDGNQYLPAELQARQQRMGFWNQENPVMPWDWRKQRRHRK